MIVGMDRQDLYRKWMRRELDRTEKTQAALAEALGLDAVKMSKVFGGTRRLQAAELERASEFLGSPIPTGAVSKSLVRSFDPDLPDRPEMDGPSGRQAEMNPDDIPELVGKGGLGSGQVIVTQEVGEMQARDEIKEEYWRFPSHFVRHVIGAQAANLMAVECQGDSMSPTLGSGERVWVDRSQNLLSPEGIYAIRDPHEAIQIKRLQYTDDSPPRIAVISDNPMHTTRVFDVAQVSIVGRVVCVMRVF